MWVLLVNFLNWDIEDSADRLCSLGIFSFPVFTGATTLPEAFLPGVPVIAGLCPPLAWANNLIHAGSRAACQMLPVGLGGAVVLVSGVVGIYPRVWPGRTLLAPLSARARVDLVYRSPLPVLRGSVLLVLLPVRWIIFPVIIPRGPA